MSGEKWFGPLELTPRERADFLNSERWAVFGALTDGGAPVGVPLSFVFEGADFDEGTPVYVALHPGHPFVGWIRAGGDVCMAVDNHQFPTKAIIASGRATVVEDPEVVRLRWVAAAGAGDPAAAAQEQGAAAAGEPGAAAGQVVVEIRFDDIVSWDSKKAPGYASAPGVHAASIQRNAGA